MAARGERKKKKWSSPRKVNPSPEPTRKPFKKQRKEKGGEQPPLDSLLVADDDDPAFPRGGGSLLSREEVAEARAEAEAEFEREEREKGRRKRRKPAGAGGGAADDLGSLFGEGTTGKLPRFANRITLKNISPNMKLWGVVIEVNRKDLVISLPGGLRGFVRLEEVSDIAMEKGHKDSEHDLLGGVAHVGQLVPCMVLRIDDDKKDGKASKRIWLSLRLSLLYKGLSLDAIQDGMVLTAQVRSVEDHGYILHFGVLSFSGFMPRSNEGNLKIESGQLLQCAVKTIDKARAIVHLSSDPDLLSKSIIKDLKGLSIDHLIPGMMVNARVHSILENGILLSFLTYFTGTADIFNLPNIFPTGGWKDDYNQKKKVNARILFIDPSTRAVGLTLNPSLVHLKIPPVNVRTGEIFDQSRVLRIDKGSGLFLEIPSSPTPSPGYVSRHDISDDKVLKLEKKFKEGSTVRVRVLGMRHLEGLVIGTLKASAFEGSVFTHSDVKPGMLVRAKVTAVEAFGAVVQFSSGLKAFCPFPHMSELDIIKPPKKFKVGAELQFRVLGCKSKRITVTHKKTLIKSKLDVLASYADAKEGLITHGWISKIEKQGCFVRFYNGVQGFARRSELGLEPGIEAESVYHVGQVIKCRIISVVPASRRISVSFSVSSNRVSQGDTAKLGTLVSGVVERLTPAAVIVSINGYSKGTILDAHLADHSGQAFQMKKVLMPGYKFNELLVLDIEGSNLILSAKQSLVNSANEIPSDISQIHPGAVVHGYICNIIETGCFVRFLGRLTGFCLKHKAANESIDEISDAFYIGQSVRSHILNVNAESSRIKLSLQQSLCSSSDVSFIQGYFLLDEKIAALQDLSSQSSDNDWAKSFSIGNLVEGEIEKIKDDGVVLNFKDHSDVYGFIADHQLGGIIVEVGSIVKALVLDLSRSDRLVELSLKPELVSSANNEGVKKKRRRATSMDLQVHQEISAIVEIVKESYAILSIPEYNYAIGFAPVTDYNLQKLPQKHFVSGQCITVTVGACTSPDSSGRLLLLPKASTEVSGLFSVKRTKKKSDYRVGSLVEGEIVDIKPLELILKFAVGFRGRIHITEVLDDDDSTENPFSKLRIGQLIHACIIAKAERSGKSGRGCQWELSLRSSLLTGEVEETSPPKAEFDFSINGSVRGYVVKIDSNWVWLTVSRHVMAHLFILDSSAEPSELQEFQQRYSVGQAVRGRIIGINKEKRLLRLKPLDNQDSLKEKNDETKKLDSTRAEHMKQGDIIGGRIQNILPGVGGIRVQIGAHLYGKAHYTELVDAWVTQPLSGFHEGQFVKCKILAISRSSEGTVHVDLSLRSSLLCANSDTLRGLCDNLETHSIRFEKTEDLCPGMDVKGYVKNVSSKGCFITLSRMVDARILLSNLSDKYIEAPEKDFPVGKLVNGRVLSADALSKKVEVTLKKDTSSRSEKSDVVDYSSLNVGDVIHGQVRRVESYGLFITLRRTKMVGLCHKSEISDEAIHDIDAHYKAGDKVKAKILKIDEERHRIALGMKKSYIEDVNGVHSVPTYSTDDDDDDDDDGDDDGTNGRVSVDSAFLASQETGNASPHRARDENMDSILPEAESRASVLPIQVPLDESEDSDQENDNMGQESANGTIMVIEKSDKRSKEKAKKQRELEIAAFEERALQKDVPRTPDEFEKLVRSSPNSSFVWINYMAFMLELTDVEKARAIAERALRTINIREEEEKLNVWVAYFNLENEYGNQPEDAVKKIFQRALQYCDPKKVHLALLAMYERTEQHKLADELLDRMTKRFKTSCKVWLRHVQFSLKQHKDVEHIKSIVNRALLSLPQSKRIKFLTQTAILEFKCGVPEEGRSRFELILREYPKRTDLWSVYLDQEIRLGDKELIRALFERATCLSLPLKKMKFLFRKYLDYEMAQGDEETIEHVKQKAREYLQSSLA